MATAKKPAAKKAAVKKAPAAKKAPAKKAPAKKAAPAKKVAKLSITSPSVNSPLMREVKSINLSEAPITSAIPDNIFLLLILMVTPFKPNSVIFVTNSVITLLSTSPAREAVGAIT